MINSVKRKNVREIEHYLSNDSKYQNKCQGRTVRRGSSSTSAS